MRLSASAIALVVGLLVNHAAQASELPQRWVSAGGALSEWVTALGGESKLVGVDTTSQHPESLKSLPSIGYQRQLSAEGILSLRPQVLVGTEEMGPPPVLAQIRNAGVQVEMFSAQPDLPTLKDNLQHLGKLLGSEAKADELFTAYAQALDQQKGWVTNAQSTQKAPGVLLLLGHAGGKPLIAGKDTAADWMLQQAGGRNLATHTGYKPFSVESLAGLSPDVLVFADRALAGEAARSALFKENPILTSTPAAKHGRVLEVDPTLLVGGLGPRLPQSLAALSAGFLSIPSQACPMTTLVKPKALFVGLALLCVLAIWLSLALGPVSLPLLDTLRAALRLMGLPIDAHGLEQAELILGQIRLPRTLLGLAVGGVLALSGVAMQGLFRNPLADPGLVGVSSGAALGAAVAIVGGTFFGGLPDAFGPYILSLCAFLGGLGVTALVYRLGRRNGQTNVATMLLAGIALTALAGSAVGLFTYLADDATLRTLTFWNLGSLNGASYSRLWPLLLVSAGVALWLPRRANALNALLLGESEANHLGIDVEGLKRELVFCTALGVGAAVAAAGMIGFVGLVVPHLVRLLAGPDHRVLLPASVLAGASLLLFADLVARLALAPAELPIGIVTAFIGAPFFLYLLLRGRA